MSPTIFDDMVRTDSSPSHEEDSFTFLNRAATPYWERVRTFIEDGFRAFPAEHANDLRSRFRDRRWPIHIGAWWELYLFTLFRRLGFDINVHPQLPEVDARPDFRISRADLRVQIEARWVAAGLVAAGSSRGKDEWITGPLNELWHPTFTVLVRITSRGQDQPRRAAVTSGVLAWLDGLDPDEVAARPIQDQEPFRGRAGDWRFELEALPMKSDTRADRRRRLVGIYPARSGMDNTATALRKALKEKAGKYGEPDCPFLIAPLLTTGSVEVEDVVEALYGTEVVEVSAGPANPRLGRRPDGFWRFGSGYRGTRVSGVLLGESVMPWTVADNLPRVWLHPAAAHPLQDTFGFPTASIDGDGQLVLTEGSRSAAEIFELDPRWPGPEPPFR